MSGKSGVLFATQRVEKDCMVIKVLVAWGRQRKVLDPRKLRDSEQHHVDPW